MSCCNCYHCCRFCGWGGSLVPDFYAIPYRGRYPLGIADEYVEFSAPVRYKIEPTDVRGQYIVSFMETSE